MVLEAVFHSTESEYCHALDPNTLVIRLRAKRGDLTRCVVCYGDRVYPREKVRTDAVEMSIVASDDLFDYFEVVIRTDLTRVCYYFLLSDGITSVYYYGYAFHQKLDDNRNLYFQYSYIRPEDIADVPEWAKEAILYQIFPDSFATGKGFIAERGNAVPVGFDCDTVRIEGMAGFDCDTVRIEGMTGFSCNDASGMVPITGDTVMPGKRDEWENDPENRVEKNGIISKSRLGGTLRGIIENLPYLESLGINCLYLTPVFTAGDYHKYDTVDYFSVDPCFGDLQTLRELVSKCHAAGIRVLLDGVFNHCSADFPPFRDVVEKGEKSRYKDWFFIRDFPVRLEKPNYECFAYVSSMPKLNTGNPEVMDYLIRVGTYWIQEADIDGWRLDVANEVNHDFWREFRKAVRKIKPDALLIGEIWFDAREWLMGDQFDSLMNYGFLYACTDFFAKRIINVKQFDERISYLRMRYKKDIQKVQMNLIDSHDVPRFLSQAGGDIRKLKLAVLFMMTHVGIPTVFYGDEKGMDGLRELEYRRPMQWKDTAESLDIFRFYQKLISIRKTHMDLMTGSFRTVDTDLACNTYVYAREANGRILYALINNSEFSVRYRLDISCGRKYPDPAGGGALTEIGLNLPEKTFNSDIPSSMKDLISGKTYPVRNLTVTVELDELSGVILEQLE